MASFQSTMWTLIGGARDGDVEALREFVLLYRPPIVGYLRKRGFSNDAEDLAQEVFLRIIKDNILTKVDPEKGRFRSLLVRVTMNVVGNHLKKAGAKKRGADRTQPLGDYDPESAGADDGFDREWFAHLIDGAFARLAMDNPNYHDSLRPYLLEEKTFDDIAEDLGIPRTTVVNHVHRGKRKIMAYIKEDVRQYSFSRKEYNEELAFIARFLPE